MDYKYHTISILKSMVLTLVFLFVPCTLYADEYVVVRLGASVYPSPSIWNNEICNLNYGAVVYCDYDENSEFQHISVGDKEGWIPSSYLAKSTSANDGQPILSGSNSMVRRGLVVDYHSKMAHESQSDMYWLLCLGLLLLILCIIIANSSSRIVLISMIVVNFVMFLIEIYHIVGYVGDVTWFYSPSQIGWMWSIINFLLCVLIIGAQATTFFFAIEFLGSYDGSDYTAKPGIIGLGIGLVAWFLCGLFRYSLGAEICYYAIIGIQIIQILYLTYKTIANEGNFAILCFSIAFYIVGLVALLLDIAAVIPSVISVGIGIFIMNILASSNRKRYAEERVDFREDESGKYILDHGVRHEITNVNTYLWRDDRGRVYDETNGRRVY